MDIPEFAYEKKAYLSEDFGGTSVAQVDSFSHSL